jgi:hypothetical protein
VPPDRGRPPAGAVRGRAGPRARQGRPGPGAGAGPRLLRAADRALARGHLRPVPPGAGRGIVRPRSRRGPGEGHDGSKGAGPARAPAPARPRGALGQPPPPQGAAGGSRRPPRGRRPALPDDAIHDDLLDFVMAPRCATCPRSRSREGPTRARGRCRARRLAVARPGRRSRAAPLGAFARPRAAPRRRSDAARTHAGRRARTSCGWCLRREGVEPGQARGARVPRARGPCRAGSAGPVGARGPRACGPVPRARALRRRAGPAPTPPNPSPRPRSRCPRSPPRSSRRSRPGVRGWRTRPSASASRWTRSRRRRPSRRSRSASPPATRARPTRRRPSCATPPSSARSPRGLRSRRPSSASSSGAPARRPSAPRGPRRPVRAALATPGSASRRLAARGALPRPRRLRPSGRPGRRDVLACARHRRLLGVGGRRGRAARRRPRVPARAAADLLGRRASGVELSASRAAVLPGKRPDGRRSTSSRQRQVLPCW